MRTSWLLLVAAVCMAGPAALVAEEASVSRTTGIGVITAVRGNVFTARASLAKPRAIRPHDVVMLRDVIETQPRSRVKALLDDDTLLTIGEDTRLEVIAYEPAAEQRRLLIKLVRGDLRVLSGRKLSPPASVVEVLTPTAEIMAGEAAFVVRADSGRWQGGPSAANELVTSDPTGIGTIVMNVGAAGRISFRSGGQRVVLEPGQRSIAAPRGVPTAPAIMLTAGAGSSGVINQAVETLLRNTALPDQPKFESAQTVIRSNGGAGPRPAKPSHAATETAIQSPAAQQSSLTPPAVISGAVVIEPSATSSVNSTAPGGSILPPVIQQQSSTNVPGAGGSGSGGSGRRSRGRD